MSQGAGSSKLKHLDYLQAVIARMAQNSFLFKGWAITLAAGLSAYGATKDDQFVLVAPIATTILFWGMDGYYLWLERAFVELYNRVRRQPEPDIAFEMAPNKENAFRRWVATCFRPHLTAFYGTMLLVLVIGICRVKSGG